MPDPLEPRDPAEEPRNPFPNDLSALPLVVDVGALYRELEREAATAPGTPRYFERVWLVHETGTLNYVPGF